MNRLFLPTLCTFTITEAKKIRIMAEHTTYLLGPYGWFLKDHTFCSFDIVFANWFIKTRGFKTLRFNGFF